jgi:hypothetical protein
MTAGWKLAVAEITIGLRLETARLSPSTFLSNEDEPRRTTPGIRA